MQSDELEDAVLLPEFGPVRIETDFGPEGYVMRAHRELSGKVREYELAIVIKALEAAGYEVRKKPPA